MSAERRIGILGGTFDPIHHGHIELAAAAQAALSLTEVLIIPSSVPPHRPLPVASAFHRFAMVSMAIGGRAGWTASDIELLRGFSSYTVDTIQWFRKHGFAARELFFIIGADAFAEIESWKDFPGFLDEAHFVVVSRPGCPVEALPERLPALSARMTEPFLDPQLLSGPSIILIDAITVDVSSSAIRRRCAVGETIVGLVDPAVQQHIEQHGLYAPPRTSSHPDRELGHSEAGRLHGQS